MFFYCIDVFLSVLSVFFKRLTKIQFFSCKKGFIANLLGKSIKNKKRSKFL